MRPRMNVSRATPRSASRWRKKDELTRPLAALKEDAGLLKAAVTDLLRLGPPAQTYSVMGTASLCAKQHIEVDFLLATIFPSSLQKVASSQTQFEQF